MDDTVVIGADDNDVRGVIVLLTGEVVDVEIGRASCRERV